MVQKQQEQEKGITVTDCNELDDSTEPKTCFTLLPSCSRNSAEVQVGSIQHPQQEDNMVQDAIDDIFQKSQQITERTAWGSSLSLPDIDDVSMNYIFLYMEHYKVDLLWSILSDSFFILGGISYIVLSGWDYYIYKHNLDGSLYNQNGHYWYVTVDIIAPMVYFLNSIIDIFWAEAVRMRLKNKQELTKIWDNARLQLRGMSFSSTSVSSTHDYTKNTDVQQCLGCTWCYRMRKYAAHRRTMMAALSFGIAATLSVVAAILRNFLLPKYQSQNDNVEVARVWKYNIDAILDALSDHVYIISAIFSMTGKRHRPWLSASDAHETLYNDSERLEDLGDLLFFIGSVMDASLSDLQLKHLVLFPIMSSILWMVDGCLYMRSDFVKAWKLRNESRAQGDVHPIKFIT
jgi:hypothetical protein